MARLEDMGVEPYLLASALNGAVAQRLARKVCAGCVTKYRPTDNVLIDAKLDPKDEYDFRKGSGCQQCHESGYRGRMGIYEVLELTPDLRRLIHAGASPHQLSEAVQAKGALNLREEGILGAKEGKTTLEEVMAVTHSEGAEMHDEGEEKVDDAQAA